MASLAKRAVTVIDHEGENALVASTDGLEGEKVVLSILSEEHEGPEGACGFIYCCTVAVGSRYHERFDQRRSRKQSSSHTFCFCIDYGGFAFIADTECSPISLKLSFRV